MQKLLGQGAQSPLINIIIGTNVAFFGLYSISTGPMKLKLRKYFSM